MQQPKSPDANPRELPTYCPHCRALVWFTGREYVDGEGNTDCDAHSTGHAATIYQPR